MPRCVELVDGPHEVEAATHGPLGIVLMRHRRSEKRKHAVAHQPRDRPAITLDRAIQALERLSDKHGPVFRVELLGDRRGAGDVGEQDSDRPPLARGRRPGRGRCVGDAHEPQILRPN